MSRYRVFLGAPLASSPPISELEWHDIHITSDMGYAVGQTSQQAENERSLLEGKESQKPTSTVARLIDGVSFNDDDITESLELSLREDILDDTVEITENITWGMTVNERSVSWESATSDSNMISFLQLSKVNTAKGHTPKREESQTGNGTSLDMTPMSDESYSKDVTPTFDTQHDSISIARLPSFHLPINRLSRIESVLRIENSAYSTRKVCLLVAILEMEGPNIVRIKKGQEAGKEVPVLKLVVGDEEGKIVKITVWRERAEEWGEMVRKGDVVYMRDILVSHTQKTPSLTASRQLKSDCAICYRTVVVFASDRRFRPDLRLAKSDPGVAKVAKVVGWLERMAGMGEKWPLETLPEVRCVDRVISSPTIQNSSMTTPASKITVHIGDLFTNAPTGSILVHACNTQGAWGGGIATAFKARFPQAYEVYRASCKENGDSLLGKALLVDPQEDDTKVNGGGKGYAIACLFTSRKFGRHKDSKEMILQSTKTAVVQLKGLLAQKAMQDWPIYGCRINAGSFRVPWEETIAVLDELDFGMTVYENAP